LFRPKDVRRDEKKETSQRFTGRKKIRILKLERNEVKFLLSDIKNKWKPPRTKRTIRRGDQTASKHIGSLI